MHCSFKSTILHIHNMDEPQYNAWIKCNKKMLLKNEGVECTKYCNTITNYCLKKHLLCILIIDFISDIYWNFQTSLLTVTLI